MNRSPFAVALFTALGLASIGIPVVLWLHSIGAIEMQLWHALTGVLSAILASFGLQLFLFNRLIFKHLRKTFDAIERLNPDPHTRKPEGLMLTHNMPAYVREKAKDWSDYRTKEVEQSQAQSKFRQQFVGNVAHELKTPIFTIEGFIDTLLDGAKEDPELCDKFLKKAAKNAMRMRLIVEDLDAIWRLESGVLGLRMEEFDIVELVQDNMEAIEAKAKRTNHKLALSDDSVHEAMVSGDEGQIAQVITNLLVNSINYGRMENGLTTVRVFHEDERVHVEVKDNGIGIELRHQSRIFERFYRVDKSRSRQDGGSGLGLSIIKHIIDAHGEKIWVESLAGEGSSFTFTLKEP